MKTKPKATGPAKSIRRKTGVMKPALSNGDRLSAEGRKKISLVQKKRWAAFRKEKTKASKPKVMKAGR